MIRSCSLVACLLHLYLRINFISIFRNGKIEAWKIETEIEIENINKIYNIQYTI